MSRVMAMITLFLFSSFANADLESSTLVLEGRSIPIIKVAVPYTNLRKKTFVKDYYNQEIGFSEVGILTPFSQRFGYPRELCNIGNRIKIYLSLKKNIIGYDAPRFTAPWGNVLKKTYPLPSASGIACVQLCFENELTPKEDFRITNLSIDEMLKNPITDIRTCHVIFYKDGILVKTMKDKVFRQYNRGENNFGL